MELKIIQNILLNNYLKNFDKNLEKAFELLKDAEISTPTFSFYTSVASVFSSKIEGENIELDSYIKHKRDRLPFLPDYTKKIDDLYNAYTFAKENEFNKKNIGKAHQLLSKHFVVKDWQGKLRTQNMYVANEDGRIEYVAASPFELPAEMENFYQDIITLQNENLSTEETFYYASMIQLVFVKIHPWNDGNGRCARLLEKWFLARKLGENAWFIESERYYYQLHQTYYNNIRALGLEYENLDFSKALPFLLMLPDAVIKK
ncbi:MAG: Fic family protein [Bacteroidota bacterium]